MAPNRLCARGTGTKWLLDQDLILLCLTCAALIWLTMAALACLVLTSHGRLDEQLQIRQRRCWPSVCLFRGVVCLLKQHELWIVAASSTPQHSSSSCKREGWMGDDTVCSVSRVEGS